MEWKTTWNDPLTNYVAPYHQLMGDKRTRTTFDETIRGIVGAGSLICQQIAAHSPVLVLRSSKGDTIRKEESPKKGVKRCRRSYECEPPRIRRKSAGCASWQQADMGQLIGFCMHASW